MADLRTMIAALTPTVPLPEGLNTATSAMGIDARGDVLVYVPPNVDEFQAQGAPFLSLSGGTMTGPLILAGDPVVPLGAATRQYVDAQLNSPNFTGIPTAPTAPVGTGTNQLATTAFVQAAITSGGEFVDAPADGFSYGRLNNNWARVLPLNGGGTISNAFLRLDGAAGTTRPLVWSSSLSSRWQLAANSIPENGNNSGSDLTLSAFSDTGGYIGQALAINRSSGPQGQGGPYIYQLAPWRQLTGGIGWPNGVIGNRQDIGQADRQPVVPLPADPFATTAGSPTVTVYWPGSCNPASGWIGQNAFGTQTWLLVAGSADVGGITPAGWLLVQSIVDNDHFTLTWTADATYTATGGGASVTVRPSYCTTTNRVTTEITFGGSGFPVQTAELYSVNPDFPPSAAGLPRYEHRWHWTVGPPDAAGTTIWNLSAIEWDLTNRGHDYGYQPNIYAANQPSVAFWIGPVGLVPGFASGGGTPINWNTVYTVFSGQNDGTVVGVYQAFSCMPNSLVGRKFDPTGHGGVGVDLYGSYSGTPVFNPFSTTLGSSVVSVQMWQGEMIGQANGDQVYIPNIYTVNGLTFGGGVYTMQNVNTATGSFAINAGTANATATGAGGGAGVWMSFLDFAPYSPLQTWGMFQHGIVTAPGAQFLSGAIIETQPGNAIQWSDGFGTASVTTAIATPGVLNLLLNAAGGGNVEANGALFTSGNNVLQAGQASVGNVVLLRPYPPGTGYVDVAAEGIDASVDLRLVATGTIRAMSPFAMPGGLSGPLNLSAGNPLQWSDGTGTASISGAFGTAGNIGITLTGAGSGQVLVNGVGGLTIAPPGTSWATLTMNAPAGNTAARITAMKGGAMRWQMMLGSTEAETGGNAGSNFRISCYADNGATVLDPALTIARSTGLVTCFAGLNVNGGSILALGSNVIQAGQPGISNIVALTPGAPGTGYASISTNGPDAATGIDLRLVAGPQGGTVRAMSPLAVPQGINGLLTMQAGQAIRWSDGTNISSINVPAGANQDMTITMAGSGRISTAAPLLLWGPGGIEQIVDIRNAAGTAKTIYLRTTNTTRWNITSDASAESGGNTGSNFSIGRFGDNGTFISNPIAINRATGNVTFGSSIGVNGAVPPGRPTVTGSRTDGTGLASLLTALVSFGLITDNTTA